MKWNKEKIVPNRIIIVLVSVFPVLCSTNANAIDTPIHEYGISYGVQFRNNTDIHQFELFYRYPLPFLKKDTEESLHWQIGSRIEGTFAYVTLKEDSDYNTGRFSIMPQVYAQNGQFQIYCGFGAGFMTGDIVYPTHDLGGRFLLNSKVGVEFTFNEHIGIDANFYHQSNASIYDHNASFNMGIAALVWRF